ncbi:MAG: ribosome biogenesis GTPase Der [Flavobacteriales bacterium]|nr:ribosome biogenesis GTPase Der [Flavobacteriales bacterium]
MNNLVAIVGRPNVGKSTFFNRLTESRDAIIDPTSGTTRDRKYGKATWTGRQFTVIDTGGWITKSEDVFEDAIRLQVEVSIEEAALILFMVDVQTGVTDLDEDIARMLRKSGKPVVMACNKVDTSSHDVLASDFYRLGLDTEVFSISASNGYGSGELLDQIISLLPEELEQDEDRIPRFSVVGRPNVGKSTLINTLLGRERNIVTAIAGTTRDSVHTHYNMYGFDFELIDTAGLRRKKQIEDQLEFYSTVRTIRSIEQSDVCMLLIDAQSGMERQDQSIFWQIVHSYRGVVIVVNKWDLIDKNHQTMAEYEEAIREKISPFTDVPILFTSNLTKQRILKAFEMAMKVNENRSRKISTSKLNDFLLPLIEHQPPPMYKGKMVRIKYVTQIPSQTPTFAFYCNLPQYVKDPYKRFLENNIRQAYDLTGVSIRLFFREK